MVVGAVYVFTRSGSTWSLEDEISGTDSSDNTGFDNRLQFGDYFGHSVSIDNNTLVAGAPRDNGSGNDSYTKGAVYIFTRSGSTWSMRREISSTSTVSGFGSSTLKNDDQFGYSVALSGNYLAVGAPYDDGYSGHDTGAVYVFYGSNSSWYERTTWEDGRYNSSNQFTALTPGSYFGRSVSLSSSWLAVGTDQSDVYAFQRSGSYHRLSSNAVRKWIFWPQSGLEGQRLVDYRSPLGQWQRYEKGWQGLSLQALQ